MDGALKVYTGVWWDETQGVLGIGVWTVGNVPFLIINLCLGIVFGLVQQPLERLFIHLFARISYTFRRNPSEEDQPLIHRASHARGKSFFRTWSARLLSVILIVLGVGWSIAGSFATRIPSAQAALSDSAICNLYGLPPTDNPIAQEKDALIQGQKEGRAGLYARGCFGTDAVTGLSQCMLFKNRAITVLKDEGQRCPFVNETYCDGDGFTAVKFTTQKIDAKAIGIKTAKNHKFKREMMCVPLNIEEPPRGPGFVEKTSPDIGHWRYDLGSVSSVEYSSDYTFNQHGDLFATDVRSYTLSTYQHVYSQGSENYWQPIPQLKIRDELTQQSQPYSLTVMFINSCRLFYKEASDDPIFPAQRTYPDSDLYYNYDSRARPLACIDWIDTYPNDQEKAVPHYRKTDPQIYDPDRKKDEFDLVNPEDSDDSLKEDKSYVFMRLALDRSTAFNAIEFRGATALDAQTKIQDYISLPLSKQPMQWIVEAKGFFETSLARVQYNALDIATGAGQNIDYYDNLTPPEVTDGDLCGMFIFQLPKDYNNTNLWIQVLLLITLIIIGVMGIKMKEDFSEDEKYSPYFDDLKLLLIEWLYRKCCCCGSRDRGRPPSNQADTNSQDESPGAQENPPDYGTMDDDSNGADGSNVNSPSQPLGQTDESSPSADLADADNYISGNGSHPLRTSARGAGASSSQAQSTNGGNNNVASSDP